MAVADKPARPSSAICLTAHPAEPSLIASSKKIVSDSLTGWLSAVVYPRLDRYFSSPSAVHRERFF